MKNSISVFARTALAVCGILLIGVLFVPLWQIDLDAPQYPEGLRMLIYPHKLGGDVEIINGLNHYIGMKTLHAEDFIEFTVLPYIIGFFALLYFVAAAWGNKKFLYFLFGLFFAFGVLAMVDFWRWEYNYGHDLDPNAAIQVPGMAYQPPLIGYKQLLNFAAFSMPATGGWLFVAVGLISMLLVGIEIRKTMIVRKAAAIIVMALSFSLMSCEAKPLPIRIGVDNCEYCKMTLTDPRFAAELLTKKGRVYKFDDIHCLLLFRKSDAVTPDNIKDEYLSDYSGDHAFVNVKTSLLLQSDELRSPMGGNIAAFAKQDSLQKVQDNFKGQIVSWENLIK
ncbi:MAG TPA: nitrous oxide reductase accessory protein NosL [Chitinophagales bacterium]|nr:nitrous oxide reductase accessory protein NosL [Chitinophagales bacterium]HQO31168.1 nitrous oxide reductase accessory protein NosL [Chitinophagales bacterium]